MKTSFNPRRLLLEVLAVVAASELCVMMVLPIIAPDLGTVAEGVLDMSMLLMLAGPTLYWRFLTAFRTGVSSAAAVQPASSKARQAILLAATTQIVGLLLTAGGVWWQSRNLDSISQSRFDQSSERIESEVVRRLNQSIYGLKGARGAIAASPNFRRNEFRAYVASRDLPTEFPGIRGFGFIERVQRSALERFVAGERADGAPDFTVRTSGQASDLYVVRYVEPMVNNREALGFDLGQERSRRAAIEYAVETGQPTLLAGISLLQDYRHSSALLFLLPVYRKGSTPQTVQERQRDLQGLLYAPIVASELLGGVTSVTDNLVDYELFDGTVADAEKLIFDADGHLEMPSATHHHGNLDARKFVVERVLNVGSRVLTLRVSSSAQFEAVQDRSSVALIGVGGAVVSFLMAMSVWLLAAGRQRAQDLAAAMTAELDRMAQVVQHTDNAVTIMDRDMRIQWINRGFSQVTGYSIEEAKGKTPGELLSSGKSLPSAVQTLLDGARMGVACRVELINRARDGHEYWANTEVQPLLNKQGVLVGFMEIGTDVTEQKKTQHQLEAAVRDAKALLDTVEMHAIVSTTDAEGCITEVNDAFCRISGYTREELIGQTHRIVSSGIQEKAFWFEVWQSIASGKPWRGEVCNRSKNGALYWVDSMIAPFVGDQGRIEKFVAISTDITARRLAAEKLRQSEAMFAASFQNAATGMALLSPKGQWLTVNPALCDFLGWSQEDLQLMTFMDVTHPDEWDTDKEQMLRLLEGQIPVYQRAKRFQHSDGQIVWGLASVSVVRNAAEEPEFVIVQIADITARKRAEEALSLSNVLMEESQAVARVGGWKVTLGDDSVYWTREIYRILETTPEDFHPTLEAGIGLYTEQSQERLRDALHGAMQSGQGFDMELEALTTKMRRIDVRVTCTATVENHKVTRLSGIFQDITERKEYEQSLKEAREKAEQATQSKGQFLANMSHEIRTPMNAILGMLKLLHNTDLNSRQRDYADKTENAAKSLLSLINDILDFSKVEAGKMQLDPQPFRVNRLMRSLSVILSSNLGPQAVEVLFDIDPQVPDVLLGDSMRLQQVLINLGGNAVKFTKQGQVVVSVKLRHLTATHAEVAFAVQDSGIGIAPEHQSHIFTGFSQAEASTTRKFGGTGLGLAISRRMVELMGGELQLTSAVGVGSTFSFVLELPLVAHVPVELEEALPPHAELRRVLVVDSNPVARNLLSHMVQSWGWPCEAVDCGEAALELIDERLHGGVFPFDVVYLDWHMSGMDGWATAARVRQMCAASEARQPVLVMLSSNSREALEQRTQEEQNLLNGFLVKPMTASMLLEAALESASSRARIRQSRRTVANQRRLSGMRILVVEDNLINQQVAEELLMSEGALVSLAANGQLGVDAIAAAHAAQQQFHAVLMDIQMPVLDGFAATQVVRQQLKLDSLPIVAMTANAMSSDRDDCLAAGMNAHVGKPFDLKALVQTLLDITGYQSPGTSKHPVVTRDARAVSKAVVPAAPVLDVASALNRMGGMTKLYLRSAKDFLEAVPEQVAKLRSLVEGDTAQCGMLAHTLKGTSALLGAGALAEAASQLEKQCRGNADAATRLASMQQLESVGQTTCNELQKAIAHMEPASSSTTAVQPNAPAPVQIAQPDHAQIQATLKRLIPQLQAADLSALETFAADRQSLETVPQALLVDLESALQDLELDTALTACLKITTWLEQSSNGLQQIRDT